MNIKARDPLLLAIFAGFFVIIGAIVNPLVGSLLDSSNTEPDVVDLYPDLLSPQPRSTDITWTSKARDPDNDPVYYKFQQKGPSTENSWEDIQDWSQRNWWTWYAAKSDIGCNTIRVLVKDNKHVQTDIGDNEKISDVYIITKSSRDWREEADNFRGQGKYDEAIEAYNNAIEIDPNNAIEIDSLLAAAWSNKGAALFDQGNYDEANKAYDEVIKLDPNDTTARNNKGAALFDQGKYDEAIKAYDEVIKLDPTETAAWNNKGIALSFQGKYDEAIKAYDEVIKLDQNNTAAWNNKGFALKALGKTTEADAVFAKTKELEI